MCIWAFVPCIVALPLGCPLRGPLFPADPRAGQAFCSEKADHDTRKRMKKRGIKVKGDEELPGPSAAALSLCR